MVKNDDDAILSIDNWSPWRISFLGKTVLDCVAHEYKLHGSSKTVNNRNNNPLVILNDQNHNWR